MPDIHCHTCGGFMSDAARISYQLPPGGTTLMAAPCSALCACATPVVYGPAPSPRDSAAALAT
jgi:hypothetical protein